MKIVYIFAICFFCLPIHRVVGNSFLGHGSGAGEGTGHVIIFEIKRGKISGDPVILKELSQTDELFNKDYDVAYIISKYRIIHHRDDVKKVIFSYNYRKEKISVYKVILNNGVELFGNYIYGIVLKNYKNTSLRGPRKIEISRASSFSPKIP